MLSSVPVRRRHNAPSPRWTGTDKRSRLACDRLLLNIFTWCRRHCVPSHQADWLRLCTGCQTWWRHNNNMYKLTKQTSRIMRLPSTWRHYVCWSIRREGSMLGVLPILQNFKNLKYLWILKFGGHMVWHYWPVLDSSKARRSDQFGLSKYFLCVSRTLSQTNTKMYIYLNDFTFLV